MKKIVFLFLFLLNAGWVFSEKEVITSFRFNHFEEGKKTWEMNAEKGEINKEKNEVYLKNFLVKFYEKEKPISRLRAGQGKIDEKNKQMEGKDNVQIESLKEKIKINTDEVRYSDQEKKIFSSSVVEVKRNKTLIKGEGLETTPSFAHISIKQNVSSFNPVKKYTILSEKMEIFPEKAIIEFKSKVKFSKEKSILNTDYLTYNEKEQVAEAEGNSELFLESTAGEKIKVNAEKIIFYESNEQIYAKGKVKIEQGENYALSEEAHYDNKDEKLILTGGPPLIYQIEGKRHGEYQAEKVIFYLAEKRISFEGNVQGTIIYPEE